MKIVPLFNGETIKAADLEIQVDPSDRKRARLLVVETSAVTEVSDEDTYTAARRAAGQLKALLDEIERDRKAAKGSFDAVGRAIQDLAYEISEPVKSEQKRILGLLEGYVAKLEAALQEQKRLEAEAKRLAQEEADRKVREARAAQDTARLAQLQLEQELAMEVIVEPEPQRGLVPDGRVNHLWNFELMDVNATVKAGSWRLLKWTLDIRACQDSVRNQLELAPDQEPVLPGIKITKHLSVSIKAAARIK